MDDQGSVTVQTDQGSGESDTAQGASQDQQTAQNEPTVKELQAQLDKSTELMKRLEADSAKDKEDLSKLVVQEKKVRDEAASNRVKKKEALQAQSEWKGLAEVQAKELDESKIEIQRLTTELGKGTELTKGFEVMQGVWKNREEAMEHVNQDIINDMPDLSKQQLSSLYPDFDTMDPYEQKRRLDAFANMVNSKSASQPGGTSNPGSYQENAYQEAYKKGDVSEVIAQSLAKRHR